MNKAVMLFAASQNKITHEPACFSEAMDFETLCKVDADFAHSIVLKTMFADPEIKEIFILLYEVKGSKEIRRRMGSTYTSLTFDQKKQQIVEMCRLIKIDIKFHDLELTEGQSEEMKGLIH